MNRTVMIFAAYSMMAFGGCVGSGGGIAGGGGGGNGGGGAVGSIQERQNAAIALGPTTDLPVSGRANYEGQVQVTMPGAALDAKGDVTVVGDVTLEVDFAAGSTSTLDGIAQNFQGTLADGNTAPIAGSLLLNPALSAVSRFDLPAPASGSTGGLAAMYEGDLEFDGTTAAVDMTLQSQAFGAGAQAFSGVANATVDFAPGEGTDFIGQGGIFILTRQ